MRITIRLDDQLHMKAKRRAAERGMTLAAFVEESLRKALDRRESRRRFRFPTFGGGGLLPGVNLDNSAELLDLMEGRGGNG